MRRCLLFAAIVTLAAAPLRAETVTYAYSGVSDVDTVLPPIAIGTPFNGTFTIDKSPPGSPLGDLIQYPQVIPPASLRLDVSGLTVEAFDAGILMLGSSDRIKLVDTFSSTTFTGAGWSFVPSGPANSVKLSFITTYPLEFGTDLANLPLLTTDPPSMPSIQVSLPIGEYFFPGGSITVTEVPTFFNLPISNLTLVPEPAGIVLAALAIAALLVLGRRRVVRAVS